MHFIKFTFIRDNYIHDGGWNCSGIHLYNCINGILENNTCSTFDPNGIDLILSSCNILNNNTCTDNYCGISLIYYSDNNTLINNNCSNNGYGIHLEGANSSTLINNNCSNNYDGITFYRSYNNTLIDNNCSNNGHGIDLSSSSSNTLINNDCSNSDRGICLSHSSNNILSGNILNENGIIIYGAVLFHWNTHDIEVSNKVNGKPVYYYKNQTGITVPDGAGQVILANCTDFVIENQNLSHADIGISLGFSSNSLIANNNCSDNYRGIYLAFSSNNTLINNNCSSNSDSGIELIFSNDNILSNNNCSSNNYEGISLLYSSNNTIIWNQLYNNIICGIYAYSDFIITTPCSYNLIWNNTFYHNNGAGDSYDPSHIQAYDDGTNNWWNSSSGYGNYWSDWTTPDGDMNGIVDNPYNIDGSAGAKDFYPQTTAPIIPEPAILILVGTMMMLFLIIGRTRKKN